MARSCAYSPTTKVLSERFPLRAVSARHLSRNHMMAAMILRIVRNLWVNGCTFLRVPGNHPCAAPPWMYVFAQETADLVIIGVKMWCGRRGSNPYFLSEGRFSSHFGFRRRRHKGKAFLGWTVPLPWPAGSPQRSPKATGTTRPVSTPSPDTALRQGSGAWLGIGIEACLAARSLSFPRI